MSITDTQTELLLEVLSDLKSFFDLNKVKVGRFIRHGWIRNPLGSNRYYDQKFSFPSFFVCRKTTSRGKN